MSYENSFKKISIMSIIFLLAVFSGFTLIQNKTMEDGKNQKNISLSYSSESKDQSGVESDTMKRLKVHSESGTNWGISPFGSGKPLIEETPEKATFQMPNTEWKTQTLSGITYEFGKGNPKEVAMSQEQIEVMTLTCGNNVSLVEKGICNAESGLMSYVTPEVEKHLLLALSDPNWNKLATECEKNFRARETYLTPENIAQSIANDPAYLTFDRVVSPEFLDIDKFIFIDPATGLKVLNNNLTIYLAQFVMNGMYNGAERGEPQPNPYGDCVDRYGQDISKNLIATTELYTNPLMDSKWIIHKIFTELTIPFSFH